LGNQEVQIVRYNVALPKVDLPFFGERIQEVRKENAKSSSK